MSDASIEYVSSSITPPSGTGVIDIIVYLASLASKTSQIDPILDKLRLITARVGFKSDKPSPKENVELTTVLNDVTDYLVSRESVRSFTTEDLQYRVAEHFENAHAARKHRVRLGLILAVSIGVGLTSIFVPITPPITATPSWLPSFHSILAITSTITLISLGASLLFLTAISSFRPILRRAYTITAVGVTVLGLAHIQMPVVGYISHLNSGWVFDGGVGIPYVLAQAIIFIGTAYFANIFGVRSKLTSWPLMALITIIGIVFVVFAPHPDPAKWSVAFFDIATSTFPVGVVVSFMATVNCYGIAKKINKIYVKPFLWLGHANAMLALAVAQVIFIRFVFGYENFWANYGLLMIPWMIASILFLKSGYSFMKASSY